MLAGTGNILGFTSSGSNADSLTEWWTMDGRSSDQILKIVAPSGYSSALVTAIAPGADNFHVVYQVDNADPNGPYANGDYVYYGASGAGGNCGIRLIDVKPGDALSLTFSWNRTSVTRNESEAIVAVGQNYGTSSSSSGEVGDRIYLGGSAESYSRSSKYLDYSNIQPVTGGGAAGNRGDATGPKAGLCDIWIRSSDGVIATAGDESTNYGGGSSKKDQVPGGAGLPRGLGLIVIQWGVSKLP